MYCIYCGSPAEDGYKFCGNCGKPNPLSEKQAPQQSAPPKVPFPAAGGSRRPAQQESTQPAAAESQSPVKQELPQRPAADSQSSETQKPEKKRPGILIAVLCVVVCILAIAAFFLFKGRTQTSGDTADNSSAASVYSSEAGKAAADGTGTVSETNEANQTQTETPAETQAAAVVPANSSAPASGSAEESTPAAGGSTAAGTGAADAAGNAAAEQAEPAAEESYYAYIKRELLPQYGYASTETASRDISFSTLESDCYWDDRTGIISAAIADLDANGVDDLVLLRFDKNTTDSQGRAVLTLNADLYTRAEDGSIYQAGSVPVLECASFDRIEYRCSLVPRDSGYMLMVQSIYWPQGQMRIFAIGEENVLELYSFDGTTWGEQYRIAMDTAGDTPFHLIAGSDDQAFTTYGAALQAAGIPLKTGTATEPYFEGELDYTLLMEYAMTSATTTMAQEATINADLSDLTGLKENIDQLPD